MRWTCRTTRSPWEPTPEIASARVCSVQTVAGRLRDMNQAHLKSGRKNDKRTNRCPTLGHMHALWVHLRLLDCAHRIAAIAELAAAQRPGMRANDLVFGLSFAGQHLRSSTVGQDHGDENLLCMVQQAGRQAGSAEALIPPAVRRSCFFCISMSMTTGRGHGLAMQSCSGAAGVPRGAACRAWNRARCTAARSPVRRLRVWRPRWASQQRTTPCDRLAHGRAAENIANAAQTHRRGAAALERTT